MQSKFKTTPLLGLTAATALFLTAALPRQAAAQFSITAVITGTAPSATANADVQNALNTLASDFSTNGTAAFNLSADINWQDLGYSADGGYTLGGSVASAAFYQTVTGASVGDVNDPSVLVNNNLDRYLYGAASTVDTSGSYADFTIQLNNNSHVGFDYTMGTPSDPNATSLASVVYHEAIHSMGFSAFNNADGSYAFTNNGGDGTTPTPTIWDTKLYDATTNQAFTLDTQAQRQAVEVSGTDTNGTGGKLFLVGAAAEAANGGNPIQMFAPNVYQDGSSDGSHLGPDNPGIDLLDPSLASGVYLAPSKIDLAGLSDIGWKLSPAAVPEASTTVSFGLLLALGMGGMVFAAKKRKSASANA